MKTGTTDADKNFFARNYNLARLVNDQEKIYVPATWEINSGIFIESQRTLDYILPAEVPVNSKMAQSETISNKLNLNTATVEELDSLPGIGQATAQKIIQNRPYKSIDELLIKKAVKKNIYENIKDLIEL